VEKYIKIMVDFGWRVVYNEGVNTRISTLK